MYSLVWAKCLGSDGRNVAVPLRGHDVTRVKAVHWWQSLPFLHLSFSAEARPFPPSASSSHAYTGDQKLEVP